MGTSQHTAKVASLLVSCVLQQAGCTYVSEETDGFPSVHMQQFKAALRPYKLGSTPADDLDAEFRDRDYPSMPLAPGALTDVARIDEQTVGDFKRLELVPRRNATDLRILYLHGGGYTYELAEPHLFMLSKLIEQTGAAVTVPIYPLAPEFSHEEAFPFVEAVYRELLDAGPASNIVIGGDSAGGGFALSQVARYRELGLELPNKLFLFSPWLDVTMSHPDMPALEGSDCILSADALRVYGRWWANGSAPSDPSFSPKFGDLTGFPPMLIFGGTDELFLPDIRELASNVGAERVQVRDANAQAATNSANLYFEYPGAMHDFPILLAPEADDAIARTAAFIQE